MAETDCVVIGAGVVGLAIAAALARAGREVILIEAETSFGTVTSSRNSEVIHAGIYYEPGSLKARLCVAGRDALYAWCAARQVPHKRIGKLIIAIDDHEVGQLEGIRANAAGNGVGLALIDPAEARRIEPNLACAGALHSPMTGIIDSHALMLSYLGDFEDHGGLFARAAPVIGGGLRADGMKTIRVGGGNAMEIAARTVVISAGLGAQGLAAAFGAANVPPLHLAKGSYFSLSGRPPFRGLVYPVPSGVWLGIHYTVDLAGEGRFGPDMEWLDHNDPARIDYAVDPARAGKFYEVVRRYWPDLPDGALRPAYSGVRPKTYTGSGHGADFLVHTPDETGVDGLFALYGIESPGLTSSLAIGDHVAGLVAKA